MKRVLVVLLVVLSCFSFTFALGNSETTENKEVRETFVPKTETEKYWYVVGEDLFAYYVDYYSYYQDDFDVKAFVQGVLDYANGDFKLTDEQIDQIATDYTNYKEKVEAETAAQNLAEAEDFLKKNAKNEGIITTKSGLQYQVVKQGTGECPKDGATVTLNYSLALSDGLIIDQGENVQFSLNQVIPGFAEGVKLMNVGSEYKLFIHPSLGYGSTSMTGMPANSLLFFDVTLISIDD